MVNLKLFNIEIYILFLSLNKIIFYNNLKKKNNNKNKNNENIYYPSVLSASSSIS